MICWISINSKRHANLCQSDPPLPHLAGLESISAAGGGLGKGLQAGFLEANGSASDDAGKYAA